MSGVSKVMLYEYIHSKRCHTLPNLTKMSLKKFWSAIIILGSMKCRSTLSLIFLDGGLEREGLIPCPHSLITVVRCHTVISCQGHFWPKCIWRWAFGSSLSSIWVNVNRPWVNEMSKYALLHYLSLKYLTVWWVEKGGGLDCGQAHDDGSWMLYNDLRPRQMTPATLTQMSLKMRFW